MDEELRDKILKQGYGFTKAELESIGVGWPPKKGWRKKILRELRRGEKKKKRRASKTENHWPSDRDGFLVRSTGSGRHHLYVNGKPLCRMNLAATKYVYTDNQPGNPPCKNCQDVQSWDPENRRAGVSFESRKAFYQSWEWKKARFETIKRYGAACMCCGSEERIVVDHIKPRKKYPELALDLDNLQVLCNDCNMGKSFDDETDFRPKSGQLNRAEMEELGIIVESDKRLH